MTDDIEQFMAPSDTPSVVTTKPTTKKRKRPADTTEDNHDLKAKARLLCTCHQQWKSVSKYAPKRMEEFIQEKEYEKQRALFASVFGTVHQIWALVADKMAKGNGYVQTELESDVTLRQAFEEEGSQFVRYITNRWKLVALTSIDVFNGKRTQLKSEPSPVVIEEIVVQDGNHQEGQSELDGKIIPDRDHQDQEDHEEVHRDA
jgi:hypothetical protein